MRASKVLIESYDFGRIIIDGVTYTSDMMIIGEKVEAGWWRKEGHALEVADIKDAIEQFAPEVVIIGTGHIGMMRVPKPTREYFESKGIEFLVERTKKACGLFNDLSKSRRTLAALHLTC